MQLGNVLKQKVNQINKDEACLEAIKNWIKGAYGGPKIVRFKTPDKAYHLVFTEERGVELREGDYPSFNLSYQGSEENILKILNGETSAKTVWQAKELHIWGGLSEAVEFEKFL